MGIVLLERHRSNCTITRVSTGCLSERASEGGTCVVYNNVARRMISIEHWKMMDDGIIEWYRYSSSTALHKKQILSLTFL
mmetsp:Transcript_46648/g.113672  ORF Transcript_46648/g.113672 Transcript_46648/m.113672 type:complete len:80 (+) Transcript_46648:836-1075(+)